MHESTPVNLSDPGLEIQTLFVRGRNVLLTKADFGTLFVDYYLHLADQKMRYTPDQDRLFRKALAAIVLHCASRPWNELSAWTLHFEQLKWNVFLNCDNESGAVTGRLFDEDVKAMGSGFFYADVIRGREPKRRSIAPFEGDDPLMALEAFYMQSEQRKLKAVGLGGDVFALVTEHPDYDANWFDALEGDRIAAIEKTETLVPLEKRVYRWHCGCNQGRMLQILAPVYKDDPEGVFAGDAKIEMRCPRCGARHVITREAIDAYMQESREI
jgi:molecular chaperone Hsp33